MLDNRLTPLCPLNETFQHYNISTLSCHWRKPQNMFPHSPDSKYNIPMAFHPSYASSNLLQSPLISGWSLQCSGQLTRAGKGQGSPSDAKSAIHTTIFAQADSQPTSAITNWKSFDIFLLFPVGLHLLNIMPLPIPFSLSLGPKLVCPPTDHHNDGVASCTFGCFHLVSKRRSNSIITRTFSHLNFALTHLPPWVCLLTDSHNDITPVSFLAPPVISSLICNVLHSLDPTLPPCSCSCPPLCGRVDSPIVFTRFLLFHFPQYLKRFQFTACFLHHRLVQVFVCLSPILTPTKPQFVSHWATYGSSATQTSLIACLTSFLLVPSVVSTLC